MLIAIVNDAVATAALRVNRVSAVDSRQVVLRLRKSRITLVFKTRHSCVAERPHDAS